MQVNKTVWRSVNCRRGILGGSHTLSLIPSSNLAAAEAHTETFSIALPVSQLPHCFWAPQMAKMRSMGGLCMLHFKCQVIKL